MRRKVVLSMFLIPLFVGLMSLMLSAPSYGVSSTTGNDVVASTEPFPTNRPVVFIDPAATTQDVGVDFTVSVKIFNLTDSYYTDEKGGLWPLGNLYGVGMNLSWDPTVLEYVNHLVKIPVDDYPDGVLYAPTTEWESNLNIDAGYYRMAYTSQNPAPVFNNPNSNNTVFEITFRAKIEGATDFLLTSVQLSGRYPGDRILHVIRNGFFSTTGTPGPRTNPIALFTYSPTTPKVGETITFNASTSYDPDGQILSWLWNFGDGTTETGEITSHAYTSAGTYSVTLTVTDNDGLTDTQTKNVRIRAYPVAEFTYSPFNPGEGQTVTFDASPSYDLDGFIISYSWDFGDGGIGTGRIAYHTYQTSGTYLVSLTVKDNDGLTSGVSNPITVLPGLHDVAIISVEAYPTRIMAGQSVWIDVEVANQGTIIETFEVTVYRDDTIIARTMCLSLPPSESRWLSFRWSTVDIAEGRYTIRAEASAVLGETDLADNMYVDGVVTVSLPKISLSPTSGPVGTKVTVQGQGFPGMEGGYLTFDDQLMGIIYADSYGSFTVSFNVPLSEAGSHSVKFVYSYYPSSWETKAAFIVTEVAPLDVNVEVGSIFFKGETVEFYMQTTLNGKPVDATFLNTTLYLPDGATQTLTWQRISTGFYKLGYSISGKGPMTGTYTMTMEARYITENINSYGTSLKTFLVKPTWEREAPRIAAFSFASIGLISAMVILWRKEKKRLL